MKIILLIVAYQGYQPIEYGHTRKVLEEAGIKVKVASNQIGKAYARPSVDHDKVCDDPECRKTAEVHADYATASVDVIIDEIDVCHYDGIFIIGGPGALEFLDNKAVYEVMQQCASVGKPYGAICISPRILARAGLLNRKYATGWDGDHNVEDVFRQHDVIYRKQSVVIDENIVTADGPQAAIEFGKAIMSVVNKMSHDEM